MVKHNVIDTKLKNVGDVELSDAIFGTEVNKSIIHEAVRACLANRRVGCSCTKTRGEVHATNKKPYKQKGTGRARHGTLASPIFVGGGITFGPRPRDYTIQMPKKKKRVALQSALSLKVKENKFLVLDKWNEAKKTKEMVSVLKSMNVSNALIILNEPNELLERTVRNIPYIDVTYTDRLNTYNIIAHDFLICTKDVVAKIQEGLTQ